MDNFYHKNTEIKSTIKVVQPSIEGRLKNPKRATRSKKLNFAHSFRPIYYVSRFYGLMPFSIVYNSKGKANEPWTGAIDILWFIISICAYISLAFLSYQNMGVPKVPNVPIVLVFADDMILVVGLVYGAVIMAMDMCNRYKLVDILRMFQTIDKELASFDILFDYKNECRRAWIYYILIISASTLLTAIPCFTLGICYNTQSTLNDCCFILRDSLSGAVSASFIILLRCLHQRFVALNSFLRSWFLNESLLEVSIIIQKRDSISTLKFIGRQHSYLTTIMDKINFCYSFQIMFCIVVTFLQSVLTFYVFYRYIFHQNDLFKEMLLNYIQWEIFYLTMFFLTVYTANLVTREGKSTFQIIHDIINCCNDSDVTTSLNQLAQQVQHRYPVATCGLFAFDWSLLFTMAAGTTTYLTILLNFEPSRSIRKTENKI